MVGWLLMLLLPAPVAEETSAVVSELAIRAEDGACVERDQLETKLRELIEAKRVAVPLDIEIRFAEDRSALEIAIRQNTNLKALHLPSCLSLPAAVEALFGLEVVGPVPVRELATSTVAPTPSFAPAVRDDGIAIDIAGVWALVTGRAGRVSSGPGASVMGSMKGAALAPGLRLGLVVLLPSSIDLNDIEIGRRFDGVLQLDASVRFTPARFVVLRPSLGAHCVLTIAEPNRDRLQEEQRLVLWGWGLSASASMELLVAGPLAIILTAGIIYRFDSLAFPVGTISGDRTVGGWSTWAGAASFGLVWKI
jgi:hypothetical protein